MSINISRHILQFICFLAVGFQWHVQVPQPLTAIVSVSVLHFVWSLAPKFLWLFKARFIFPLRSMSVLHFSGSHVEIIFRLFSLRTKRNGEKEMKILKMFTQQKKYDDKQKQTSVLLPAFESKQV